MAEGQEEHASAGHLAHDPPRIGRRYARRPDALTALVMSSCSPNRMRESLHRFESVINSRWFLRIGVILFLNKIDVFRRKLLKFMQEYRHVTEATNTKNICLVFAAVKETILQHPLKDSWPDTGGWNGGREGRMDEPMRDG
ncbi:hypothetical protein C8J57DRAFT_1504180 [Mycena rebaudengoi]|nr:hypothetical protein C8J57DRAFT_1504180 [Mycena rebaudengoi]